MGQKISKRRAKEPELLVDHDHPIWRSNREGMQFPRLHGSGMKGAVRLALSKRVLKNGVLYSPGMTQLKGITIGCS
jgi:hypothetical protein